MTLAHHYFGCHMFASWRLSADPAHVIGICLIQKVKELIRTLQHVGTRGKQICKK